MSSLPLADLSSVLTGLTGDTASTTYDVDTSQSTSPVNIVQPPSSKIITGIHTATICEIVADQPGLNWFIDKFNHFSSNSWPSALP